MVNLIGLQKAIQNFYSLTKSEFTFYSTGALVTRKQIISSHNVIFNSLESLNFVKLCIFPFVVNTKLSGFFIAESAKTPSASESIYCDVLSTTIHHFLPNVSIQILDMLTINEITDFLSYLSIPQPSTSLCNNYSHGSLVLNIQRVLEFIEDNLTKNLSLDMVSKNVYLSSSYLSRIFKKQLSINFIDYVNTRKICDAQKKLLTSTTSITNLSQSLGFSQPSYFTKLFKSRVSISPSDYRKQYPHIQAVHTCPRTIDWQDHWSVLTASRNHFNNLGIEFKSKKINGVSYIDSIDGLSSNSMYGWIYTVDCIAPKCIASKYKLSKKCVIQWIYTKVTD